MIDLELPWPPSVNHYKQQGRLIRTKSGKLFQSRLNTPATNQFYYEVWKRIAVLKSKKPTAFEFCGTFDLWMAVNLFPPDKRRRDIDNSLKVLLDSLVRAGLIQDDSQIARLMVQRCEIVKKGKVVLFVGRLSSTA